MIPLRQVQGISKCRSRPHMRIFFELYLNNIKVGEEKKIHNSKQILSQQLHGTVYSHLL